MVPLLTLRTFLLYLALFHGEGVQTILGSKYSGDQSSLGSHYHGEKSVGSALGSENEGVRPARSVLGSDYMGDQPAKSSLYRSDNTREMSKKPVDVFVRTPMGMSKSLWAESFLANLFGSKDNGGVRKVIKRDARPMMYMDYGDDYYDEYENYNYDMEDFSPRRMENMQGIRNGGTRLSITNNLDVLRSQLRNALRRKHQRFGNGETTQRPGLHTLG